jgi:hypothetical protein
MDAAIDCALSLHRALGPFRPRDITGITVDTSLYTVLVNRQAGAYLRGPDSPVSALVFALPYLLATALLTGGLTTDDFTPPQLSDPDRWAVAGLVRIELDHRMTHDLFHCEVPFGEALRQAGPRSAEWLRVFGSRWQGDGQWLVDLVGELEPPSKDFLNVRKSTPARVRVTLNDGRSLVSELDVPAGAVGSADGTPLVERIREKFIGTGGSEELADAVDALESASVGDVARLLSRAFE